MFCDRCSKEVSKNVRICPQCGGRSFSEKVTEAVQNQAGQQAPPQSASPEISGSINGGVNTHFEHAGFWKRVAAFFIDVLILIPLSLLFGFAVGFIVIALDMTEQDMVATVNIANNGMSIILGWLWFAKFESSRARATPGKRIMKLKVVDTDGNRISFGRASGRHFGKVLSGLLLGIGYLMVGFTENKQGLHDQMAHTYVVRQHIV